MPTVVNAGKAIIAGRMIGATPTQAEPKFTAMGTGATAEAATQTALVTDSGVARVSGTATQVTVTVTNDTYQVVATLTAAGALAITESGLFDASTAGNMLMRALFAAINLAAGDSIQFTTQVKFA